jgi:uncharacterized membrane protein
VPIFKIEALPIPAGFQGCDAAAIGSFNTICGPLSDHVGAHTPVVWRPGAATLATLGIANDIDQSGNAVGFSFPTNNQFPILWPNGAIAAQQLAGLGDRTTGGASAINEHGQIAGYLYDAPLPDVTQQLAVVWDNAAAEPRRLPGFTANSYDGDVVSDINANGIAVGSSGWRLNQPGSFAYLWDPGLNAPVNLDGRPIFVGTSNASAINSAQAPLIVGTYFLDLDPPYPSRACVWTASNAASRVELNAQSEFSLAFDVNVHGEIVGRDDGTAVLWTQFGQVILDDPGLSEAQALGWTLTAATAISDAGQIAGNGFLNGDTTRPLSWLMTPLHPERAERPHHRFWLADRVRV